MNQDWDLVKAWSINYKSSLSCKLFNFRFSIWKKMDHSPYQSIIQTHAWIWYLRKPCLHDICVSPGLWCPQKHLVFVWIGMVTIRVYNNLNSDSQYLHRSEICFSYNVLFMITQWPENWDYCKYDLLSLRLVTSTGVLKTPSKTGFLFCFFWNTWSIKDGVKSRCWLRNQSIKKDKRMKKNKGKTKILIDSVKEKRMDQYK